MSDADQIRRTSCRVNLKSYSRRFLHVGLDLHEEFSLREPHDYYGVIFIRGQLELILVVVNAELEDSTEPTCAARTLTKVQDFDASVEWICYHVGVVFYV